MREQVLDDVVARRFLLGELPEEEQWRIEELAFEDPDTFSFLESAEDDLVDDFIRNELSADEKQRFENHFLKLVPGRRKYVETSRLMVQGFDKRLSEEPSPRPKPFSFLTWFKDQNAWLQIPLTAAMLAVIVIAVWLLTRPEPPPTHQAGQNPPVATPTPELKISPAETPTQSPVHVENKPKPTPGTEVPRTGVAYALLQPGSLRSQGPQQLQLPSNSPNVGVDLLVTRVRHKTYEVILQTEDGTPLQRWANLKPQKSGRLSILRIMVPVDLLKPQHFYQIVVNGVMSNGQLQEIDQYPFEPIK